MTVELKVPSVGESITEVQIGEWLKGVGDAVRRDETIVMIETDKVTVELPAPMDGVIAEVRVKQGQTASVGDVIGILQDGALTSPSPAPSKPSEAPKPEAPKPERPPASVTHAPAVTQPAAAAPQPPAAKHSEPPPSLARVMPSARRAMAQEGLSPDQVTATGPGGRVLKEDVMRAAQRSAQVTLHAAAAAPERVEAGGGEEIVPMTLMRRRIAERLVESQQSAALLTTFNEVDMSEVMALRKEHQAQFTERHGVKLGFMSFFVKAAIEALKLIPAVNAEIRGTDIVYKSFYDIGVAVGGGRGLVVPVIRGADRKSFAEVEKSIADFGERARSNKLTLDELQGGTFTISNGGIYGSLMSTPIVNPPQSGILGLHAISDRPVARAGQVVIRPMMYIALTYDHRLIDGREAVTFLKRIKECVEAPTRILLET